MRVGAALGESLGNALGKKVTTDGGIDGAGVVGEGLIGCIVGVAVGLFDMLGVGEGAVEIIGKILGGIVGTKEGSSLCSSDKPASREAVASVGAGEEFCKSVCTTSFSVGAGDGDGVVLSVGRMVG